VGLASALTELLDASLPQVNGALDSGMESAYSSLPSLDFSRTVLANAPQQLLVLEDAWSGWTDLGNVRRVMDVLATEPVTPAWLKASAQSERHPSIALAQWAR
jgi:hypothetical protein